MKKFIFCFLFVFVCFNVAFAQKDSSKVEYKPTSICKYAQKDGKDLYFNFYQAKDNLTYMGKQKPAVIFVFGGGFIRGTRDDASYLPWFKMLNDNGYSVFTIDYRLGLVGKKVTGIASVNALDYAIHIGVEDLFDATKYIINHAEEFNISPDNLVISGSSAGAIIVLQSEYELSNDAPLTKILPKDFNYAGVMAFSGAILSRKGKLKFKKAPCPTLMLHGTSDKVVPYNQIKFFNIGFFGTNKITERYKKFNFIYNTLRFNNNTHEVATCMEATFPDQLRFLEVNVINKQPRIVDALIQDPKVVYDGCVSSLDDLYK